MKPWGIAATDDFLFWTNSENNGLVFRRAWDGGAQTAIASAQGNPDANSGADPPRTPGRHQRPHHRDRPDQAHVAVVRSHVDLLEFRHVDHPRGALIE